jgi:hypothetical protein
VAQLEPKNKAASEIAMHVSVCFMMEPPFKVTDRLEMHIRRKARPKPASPKPTSGSGSEDLEIGELSLDPPNYFAAAGTNSLLLGVIDHPADVDDYDGFIADNPSVMPGRKQRHITRPEFVLSTIVQPHGIAGGLPHNFLF